ncbi:hypothetical protein OIO90_001463 [Microbotryomycetes sp. JL221]|nr:hypothetical protein OIO90_001463 [Microbotryomycetes sp. JL221]
MPIKLLHHKSYHVYNEANVARVKRDEAEAEQREAELDRREMLADSEARLDRMRDKLSTNKKKRRDRDDEGERELDRQLNSRRRRPGHDEDHDEDQMRRETNNSVIVRPADDGDRSQGPSSEPQGHINFWAELEGTDGATKPSLTPAQIQKALERDKLESLTRMYIAKRGEGEPKGWYASEDGQTDEQRKLNEEAKLERAYKDGEQKRLTDPLAQMQAYLTRRDDVLLGREPKSVRTSRTYRERYLEPATPSTNDGRSTPVTASLLGPRKRPNQDGRMSRDGVSARPSSSNVVANSSSSSRTLKDPVAESTSRVSSERARAQALIAQKRKAALAASSSSTPSTVRGGSDTPRSDWGNLYNKDAVLAARERRDWGPKPSGSFARTHSPPRERASWDDHKRQREERLGSRRW